MSDVVIELKDVWKKFPMTRNRPGFKEFILTLKEQLKRRKQQEEWFFALKGLNLEIRRGQCLGIIGANGAGKSTLLAIMLGTMKPTQGSITVTEPVTPLLQLGAGFHPDLTGRENALLNGVLQGLTKQEVLDRMERIKEFAGIGEFFDMPSRTYSSGMYMRLAFSVAINADPKLLVIDEILAVGDETFQAKSREALVSLIKGGSTTVFVSHDMNEVRQICTQAAWMRKGRIEALGEPGAVVDKYQAYYSIYQEQAGGQ